LKFRVGLSAQAIHPSTGNNMPSDDPGPGRAWLEKIDRIYLDTSVFESPEGILAIRQVVMPEVARWNGHIQLWVYDSTLQQLEHRQAKPSANTSVWQDALNLLREVHDQKHVVRCATGDASDGHDTAAHIKRDCLVNQFQHRQLVVTQSSDLANSVVANSHSGADRKAKRVMAYCVGAGGLMSWNERRREPRNPVINQDRLTRIAAAYTFVIDTCSLLHVSPGVKDAPAQSAPEAMGLKFIKERLILALEGRPGSILLPQAVLTELHKLVELARSGRNPPQDPSLSHRAAQALELIEDMQKSGLAQIIGDAIKGQHADPNFVIMLTTLGVERDLFVITQDTVNAQRLLSNRPDPPRHAIVARIERDGVCLLDWSALPPWSVSRNRGPAAPELSSKTEANQVAAAAGQRDDLPAEKVTTVPPPARSPRPGAATPAPDSGRDRGLGAGQPAGAATPASPPPSRPSAPAPRPRYSSLFGAAPSPASAGTAADWRDSASAQRAQGAHPVLAATKGRGRPLWPFALVVIAVFAGAWTHSGWSTAPGNATASASGAFEGRGLRLQLQSEGMTMPMDGDRVYLASGSRFTVLIGADMDGRVEVHTVNALGQRSNGPIWTSQMRRGEAISTPPMRVEGKAGEDLLRIRVEPLGPGVPLEGTMRIVHR